MKVEVRGIEKGFDTPIKLYLWVVKVYGILSPILLGKINYRVVAITPQLNHSSLTYFSLSCSVLSILKSHSQSEFIFHMEH